MPMRTVREPSLTRTHSCSAVYFRSDGTSDTSRPFPGRSPVPADATLPTPSRTSLAGRDRVTRRAERPQGSDADPGAFADRQFTAGGTDDTGHPARDVERGVERLGIAYREHRVRRVLDDAVDL